MKTGIKNSIVALGMIGFFATSAGSAFAAYFNQAPIARCDTQIISTLAPGSQGGQVVTLQNVLVQGGYMFVAPNGYYGPSTTAGVKRFQIENAIYPTGTVGPTTLNAINERLCDNDVRGDSLSYDMYSSYTGYGQGYATGVTYVDTFDPFVQVVSPTPANPTVYTNPPTAVAGIPNVTQASVPAFIPVHNSTNNVPTPVPATTGGVQSTSIIYSPYVGYTYGIVPQPGVLTITTPVANTTFNEGDTVTIAWTTSNINASQYQIVLENTSSGQKKVVAVTSAMSASFVLTKDTLDAVCSGVCDNSNTGSFKILVTTPITDIAGVTSTFRAAVAPVTIKRPYYGAATVNLSASKTPINSGEVFKLYVSVPNPNYTYNNVYTGYTFRIRAVCQSSVAVSIAGTPCGQNFVMPVTAVYFQQEIPVAATNTSWFRQDVTFILEAVDATGRVAGASTAVVTVNGAPFGF